jgi:hypothetical protein
MGFVTDVLWTVRTVSRVALDTIVARRALRQAKFVRTFLAFYKFLLSGSVDIRLGVIERKEN